MTPPEIAIAAEANISTYQVAPLLREMLASSPTAKRLLLASLEPPKTHCGWCNRKLADCKTEYPKGHP